MVARNLPHLRRYARALTGSQRSGDQYAIATLEAVLEDASLLRADPDIKVALFAAFHAVWSSSGAPIGEADTRLSAAAQQHMARLTPNSREALLLRTIEGFSANEVARIMRVGMNEATALIDRAVHEMSETVVGKVMIIEDEAIISMDLSWIVEDMGHVVVGVARTHGQAVEMFARHRPDLVLTDIQLADNSSGIDAVADIMERFGDLPIIFITAFPERLLTGQRNEPAFIINKPYSEEQVRSAVSQAMFFSSTEPLMA